MPRIRYIKPEFFTDSLISEISALERLFFIGLWCHADREGRLEDKPKELKVKIMPYDNCDIEKFLNELVKRRLINRYVADDKKIISITNFLKHQRPHHTEKVSELPQPPKIPNISQEKEITVNQPLNNGDAPLGKGMGNGDGEGNGEVVIPNGITPPAKKGNKELNLFLERIEKETGLPPVAGARSRQFAWNFLRALKKKYKDQDEVELATRIVQIAVGLQDGWHSTKAHDPKHLFYNWQEIVAKTKKNIKNSIPSFGKTFS